VVPSLGKVSVARLTAQQVQHLYSAKISDGLSTTTVHHLAMVLHKALGHAERLGLVARNVTELVDTPRMAHHELQVLDRDQVRRLLEAAREDRLGALYILAVSTGMRQGELLGLRWSDVDLDRGVVQVQATLQWGKQGSYTLAAPKTRQSRRQITLTTVAHEALRAHRVRQAEERLATGIARGEDDLIFTSRGGTALDGRNLARTDFARLLKRAELPAIRFHDLRHTAATLLLGQGVNPKIVSEMLGHSKIGITLDIYSHVLPAMQQQAAAAMDVALGS
jgi:integrase